MTKTIKKGTVFQMQKSHTPNKWSKYNLASMAIKTIQKREPFYLYSFLSELILITRQKPLIARFYDNSKGKIGKQRLSNID